MKALLAYLLGHPPAPAQPAPGKMDAPDFPTAVPFATALADTGRVFHRQVDAARPGALSGRAAEQTDRPKAQEQAVPVSPALFFSAPSESQSQVQLATAASSQAAAPPDHSLSAAPARRASEGAHADVCIAQTTNAAPTHQPSSAPPSEAGPTTSSSTPKPSAAPSQHAVPASSSPESAGRTSPQTAALSSGFPPEARSHPSAKTTSALHQAWQAATPQRAAAVSVHPAASVSAMAETSEAHPVEGSKTISPAPSASTIWPLSAATRTPSQSAAAQVPVLPSSEAASRAAPVPQEAANAATEHPTERLPSEPATEGARPDSRRSSPKVSLPLRSVPDNKPPALESAVSVKTHVGAPDKAKDAASSTRRTRANGQHQVEAYGLRAGAPAARPEPPSSSPVTPDTGPLSEDLGLFDADAGADPFNVSASSDESMPGPSAASNPQATGAASAARRALSTAWLRAMMSRPLRTFTLASGWQMIELQLEDGDGTLVLKTRHEDDRVAVALGFSDPVLRTQATAQANQLRSALEAQYATAVDLSFMDSHSDSSKHQAAPDMPHPPASLEDVLAELEESIPTVQRALAGSRHVWIG